MAGFDPELVAELAPLREEMREVTEALRLAAVRRTEIALKIGAVKRAHGAPVYDEVQEQKVIDEFKEGCEGTALPPAGAGKIIMAAIEASRDVQQAQGLDGTADAASA